jgi:hypothetical protein
MKESYVEGVANHSGPESCATVREDSGEALTGVRAGRVLSRGITLPDADPVGGWGRPHRSRRYRETRWGPARSKTWCMHGSTSREIREILSSPAADGAVGRVEKSKDARRQ